MFFAFFTPFFLIFFKTKFFRDSWGVNTALSKVMRIFCKKLRRDKLPKLTTFCCFFQLPHSAVSPYPESVIGSLYASFTFQKLTILLSFDSGKVGAVKYFSVVSFFCIFVSIVFFQRYLGARLGGRWVTWCNTWCLPYHPWGLLRWQEFQKSKKSGKSLRDAWQHISLVVLQNIWHSGQV